MLSIPHLIVIFIVALVVFGPQKLPELARNLGKIMAEFRKATGDLRSTFDEHMRELERESQVIEQRKRDLDAREAALRTAQAAPAAPAIPAVAAGDAIVAAAEANPPVASAGASLPVVAEGSLATAAVPEGTIPHERPTDLK